MIRFKKTTLENGIRVVTEFHPQSRAVSLGVWATTGTRDEKVGEEGISHFLEHLVFKGTKTRNAYQIARALEAVGGELNAYTTKEYTVYHALILREHWSLAMDVLADLVTNMKISSKDFTLEKGVILQEIAMGDDAHEEVVYDELFDAVYGPHPLSKPILGTIRSITNMKLSQVMKVYREKYDARSLIVTAAGNIDHEELVAAVKEHLGRKKKLRTKNTRKGPRWKSARKVIEKDGEQVHCLWAFPTSSFKDSTRFEAFIVNAALGGGMTSRLYQAVRERKGLVYSIYSSLNTFMDTGLITIYAGADIDKVEEVGDIVARELRRLKKTGLSKSDVELFKTQVIGGILLGADDVDNRMNSLGVNEMVFGKSRTVEEVVEEIRKVDEKSVNKFIREKLHPEKMGGILLGPGVKQLADWWSGLDFVKE